MENKGSMNDYGSCSIHIINQQFTLLYIPMYTYSCIIVWLRHDRQVYGYDPAMEIGHMFVYLHSLCYNKFRKLCYS